MPLLMSPEELYLWEFLQRTKISGSMIVMIHKFSDWVESGKIHRAFSELYLKVFYIISLNDNYPEETGFYRT